MPHLALWLVTVSFLLLFVLRTVLQWWRTGSGGVRGFSGAVGSLEWTAGVVTSLGLVTTLLAPAVTLAGWPGGDLWFVHPAIHGYGAALVTLGVAGALGAQLTMGSSWRIGVDQSERTHLVTDGIFSVVRNPIFSFMLLCGLGLVLLLPSAFALLALALIGTGIEVHVRVVEEPYLERTHGAAYRAYAARVGRFVPAVGLWIDPGHQSPGDDAHGQLAG
jgi:protein-S-isoprenylcysteine O-methyltransferase Ste14